MSVPGGTDVALYLAAGALLGWAYFAALLRTSRLLAAGAGLSRAAPLCLLRFALAGAAFWLVAQQGGSALLLALSGFLVARIVFQSRTRVA